MRAIQAAFVALLVVAAVVSVSSVVAQTPPSYRIGFLMLIPGEATTPPMKAFIERLRELGYVEGRNVTLDYRSADGHADRLAQLAADLVRAKPHVIVAGFGTLTAQAAKAATTTIPIVFTTVGDPIGAGVVSSLRHPGGNVTGMSGLTEIGAKRLQLLQEIVPGKHVVAVLMNPETPFTRLALKEVKTAADTTRTSVVVAEARKPEEVNPAIDGAARAGAAGLIVLEDPLTYSVRREIAALAVKLRLPTIYGYRDFAEAGGLMSYGTDRRQLFRRAAEYVDRILRGAKPGDLPVERPTKFELIVNLKAASAIGIAIPASLLARADETLE